MKLTGAVVVFSAFLSVGATLSSGQSSILERATCSGPKCSDSPNAIDAGTGDKPKPSPSAGGTPSKQKGINCDVLLRQDAVNCTGLSAKTCDLITWLYAVSASKTHVHRLIGRF